MSFAEQTAKPLRLLIRCGILTSKYQHVHLQLNPTHSSHFVFIFSHSLCVKSEISWLQHSRGGWAGGDCLLEDSAVKRLLLGATADTECATDCLQDINSFIKAHTHRGTHTFRVILLWNWDWVLNFSAAEMWFVNHFCRDTADINKCPHKMDAFLTDLRSVSWPLLPAQSLQAIYSPVTDES